MQPASAPRVTTQLIGAGRRHARDGAAAFLRMLISAAQRRAEALSSRVRCWANRLAGYPVARPISGWSAARAGEDGKCRLPTASKKILERRTAACLHVHVAESDTVLNGTAAYVATRPCPNCNIAYVATRTGGGQNIKLHNVLFAAWACNPRSWDACPESPRIRGRAPIGREQNVHVVPLALAPGQTRRVRNRVRACFSLESAPIPPSNATGRGDHNHTNVSSSTAFLQCKAPAQLPWVV